MGAIADILLVDDTAYNLRFLAHILNRRGYEVRKALSSAMALVAVQTRQPDLILLDVMMPEIDGYELCRRLKADPSTQAIPIIFLTALNEASEKVKAFRIGAADYITKPFQTEEVCARVNHQLELGRLQRQLAQQNHRLLQEQQRSEALLHNLLPDSIAHRLTHDPIGDRQPSETLADSFEAVTILFADITDFTAFASKMAPVTLVELLNRIFSRFDQLAEQYGLEKIKTIGDAYMVAGGIPEPRPDHSQDIARMALAMQSLVGQFKTPSGEPIRLRIGIHRGPVVGGVIGIKRLSYDLWGDTVNVASRMELYSEPGKIQVSEVVYEQLKQQFCLAPRGPIEVKGKGIMNTYWLLGEDADGLAIAT
ncbi:MAG: response regulator [Synechococcales cyanobacterium RM1_1_8]|nr:response regulator [Synechococcales cyanobacterium RM1_1_8]